MSSRPTRESESRRKDWKPPNLLDTPAAPPGYALRWVRVHIHNQDDLQNVAMARKDGWEFVRPSDPYFQDQALPVHGEGRYQGVVGVGDLALAINNIEVVEARKAYERDMTQRQQAAVDNDLLKEQHPSMPVIRERSTTVSGGKRRARIQGE